MSTKLDELRTMARKAGVDGIDYQRFLRDEATEKVFEQLDEADIFGTHTTANIEASFVEGRREYRQTKGGWIVAWTTARAEYDQFGTEEVECCDWNGRSLRKVLMSPGNEVYQRSRYMSGSAVWDEDPSETERKIRETIDRENVEAEERKRVREEGLLWLRDVVVNLDLEAENEDAFDIKLRARGLVWNDVRAEQKRRSEEIETSIATQVSNEAPWYARPIPISKNERLS